MSNFNTIGQCDADDLLIIQLFYGERAVFLKLIGLVMELINYIQSSALAKMFTLPSSYLPIFCNFTSCVVLRVTRTVKNNVAS